MRSRLAQLSCFVVAWMAVLVPAALAQEIPDNGEGYLGETDDKIVTFFSLGVLLFFVLAIVVGTLIQQRLERRKEEEKGNRVRQRVGW